MFNFAFDKKTLYIIMGVLILLTLVNYLGNPDALYLLVLTIPGVLVAITFHEFAHVFAASKLGDDTAKRQGRLNLNPLSHMDPIGTLMLLFAGFGWGKPVAVDPRNYSRKYTVEQGEAIVSIAGPLMNILLAFVISLIIALVGRFAPEVMLSQVGIITMQILMLAVSINIGLGVFNLIPLPPLDGSKVIMLFLPNKAKYWFNNNSHIFYLVFVILFVTGFAGEIISPAVMWITELVTGLAGLIVGVGI